MCKDVTVILFIFFRRGICSYSRDGIKRNACCFSFPNLLPLIFPSKTRFRWFQESSMFRDAPPFALDGVYISEPCPNHCGGHGDCISGVCFCDMGYTGTKLRKKRKNNKALNNNKYVPDVLYLVIPCSPHSGAG